MAQNIALQARAPQVNLPALERSAQDANLMDYKLQNAPVESELEALKMRDEIGERNAMGGYREAVSKGDPNALDKLSSQPKMQKEMYEAFDGMSPKEFMAAKKRADRIRNAARYVGKIDPNDLGQNERWGASAKVLLDEGVIDKGQYNLLIESGPNEFILQQAETTAEWMDHYGGKNAKDDKSPEMKQLEVDKIKAEIEKINRTGADDETSALKLQLLEAQIGKLGAETEAKKAGDGKQSQTDRLREKQFGVEMEAIGKAFATAIEAAGPEEIEAATAKFAADRAALEKRYGMTDAAAAPAGPTGAVDEDFETEFSAYLTEYSAATKAPPTEKPAILEVLKKKRQEIMKRYGKSEEEMRAQFKKSLSPGLAPPSGSPPTEEEDAVEVSQEDALTQAQQAIADGADPEKIKKRLIEKGYDPTGL